MYMMLQYYTVWLCIQTLQDAGSIVTRSSITKNLAVCLFIPGIIRAAMRDVCKGGVIWY